MAFGGGTWLTQNKILPGSYINFTSVSKASAALSDRGVAALPIALTWGVEGEVFEVTNGDFQKKSLPIFGFAYDAPEMLPLRELFLNAKSAYLYRLASDTAKANCTLGSSIVATAKYGGSRGNKLKLVIAINIDDPATFDVKTYLGGVLVDSQDGVNIETLKDSDYCIFKRDAVIEPTAGVDFTGGSDGIVTGTNHQDALDKLEAFSFNTLGCASADETTKQLYVLYTKRMRDEIGSNFQLVGYKLKDADYEGVISVENAVINDMPGEYGLVFYTLGMQAGCEVNRSCTNRVYNGELTVSTDFTQKKLEEGIKAGKFMYHLAGGAVRVLDDINSLVTLTDTHGAVFQANQTIRVCDQIANDTAVLFNTRYLGVVPNDGSGRMSLWNDICKLIQELERIRAVENFDTASLTVEQGDVKKAVLVTLKGLNVINAMAQLYMSVVIE